MNKFLGIHGEWYHQLNWLIITVPPHGQEKHGTAAHSPSPMREVSPSIFTLVYQLAWGVHRIDYSSVPAVSENPQMMCFWSLVRVKFRKLMYSLSVKNTSTFWTWWNRNMAFVKEIISIRTEVVTIFVGQNYVRFDFVEFARVNKSLVQPKKHRLFIVIMKVKLLNSPFFWGTHPDVMKLPLSSLSGCLGAHDKS